MWYLLGVFLVWPIVSSQLDLPGRPLKVSIQDASYTSSSFRMSELLNLPLSHYGYIKGERGHPTTEMYFGCMCPQSHSFGNYSTAVSYSVHITADVGLTCLSWSWDPSYPWTTLRGTWTISLGAQTHCQAGVSNPLFSNRAPWLQAYISTLCTLHLSSDLYIYLGRDCVCMDRWKDTCIHK